MPCGTKSAERTFLLEAYRRCRANAGAAGVDGETFARIDARGVEQWLGMLREELVSGSTCPSPSCAYGYRRAMEANGLSASRRGRLHLMQLVFGVTGDARS